jgi:hypothetical protein
MGAIFTFAFGFDAHCYFKVGENVGSNIFNDIETIPLSQNPKPSSHITPTKNLKP